MKSIFFLSALYLMSWGAIGSELDRDMANQEGANYAGTVILRVDQQTDEVAVFETEQTFSDAEIESVSANFEYQPLPSNKIQNELDEEAGTSSWYFYYYRAPIRYGYGYGYRYPYYYRYGYSYAPYYNYYSYNRRYSYYCYRWY